MKRAFVRRLALAGAALTVVASVLSGSPAQAVVGGTTVPRDSYPYLVNVWASGEQCDGSVISDSWVLTAAHCLDWIGPSDGPGDVTVTVANPAGTPGARSWIAQQLVVHKLWDGDAGHGHDLALIRVPDGALAGIPPVEVGTPWDAGAYAAGAQATIMGDPTIDSINGGGTVNVAQVQLQSDSTMRSIGFGWIDQLMIGAGSRQATTCFGDSGGPLVVTRDNHPVEVGVVSFGDQNCDLAAGFAQLDGAQLAWVASQVPSIMDGWGGCLTGGAPGTPNAYYGDTSITGSATDGTKFWNIWCAALGSDGRPTAVTGDLDRDGRTDIALVGVRTTGTVPVALSHGDGTVTTTAPRMADFNGWSRQIGVRTITGDFDGDQRTDIALIPGPGTPWWTSIPVAFANGDGTFRVTNVASPTFAGNWAQVPGVQVVSGDFNRDGRTDIALAGAAGWTTIPVAFSNGDGSFTVTQASSPNFAAWAYTPYGAKLWAGDFNHDGRTDLALTSAGYFTTIPVAFSNGDGTFTVTNADSHGFEALALTTGAQMVTGDFNHDGNTDFALAGAGGWTAIPVAFSNGDGSFTVTTASSPNFAAWAYTPYGAKLWAGDFNHDGRTDLALTSAGYFTTIPVAFSNGDGTFTVTNADSHGFEWWAVTTGAQMVTGDFNHDGNTDFALTGGLAWSTIPMAFSTGDGGFRITNAPAADFAGLAQPRYVHVPDVHGQALTQASATLATVGLAVNHPILTAVDPTCNNIGQVVAESPTAGSWIDTATAVTITLGQQPTATLCQ